MMWRIGLQVSLILLCASRSHARLMSDQSRNLERDVRYKGPGIAQKIHGVVVAAAAQEGEKVAAPVRHPESQLSFANNTTTTVASWPRQRSRRSELAYAISARIMNRLADSTAGTATRPPMTNTKTI